MLAGHRQHYRGIPYPFHVANCYRYDIYGLRRLVIRTFIFNTRHLIQSINHIVLTFRLASVHRQKLKAVLKSSPNITTGHYFRLMATCMVEIAFTVPLGVYSIVLNASGGLIPYQSWENIHWGFSRVGQYPIVVLQSIPNSVLALESSRWSYVFCSFVLFMFFGWGREMREGYHRAFQIFTRYTGVTRPVQSVSRNTPARFVAATFIDKLGLIGTQQGRCFLRNRAVGQ